MARYKFVRGLPVVTMAEGKRVGKVDDLVADPDRRVVSWLRLHSGGVGMLGGERLWVSAEAVHGVGEDAVTINAEGDARAPSDVPEALALVKTRRRIIGNQVLTENGEHLGEVLDYEFNPDTFALISLSVPPGMNVAVGKVLTIGESAIVVAADAVTRSQGAADSGNAPAA